MGSKQTVKIKIKKFIGAAINFNLAFLLSLFISLAASFAFISQNFPLFRELASFYCE